uniref:G-protein coupled receptor 54-like n=1 Tax=Saccoglossus kowalevskii TaxID=10224 RepID=A0ABM0MDI8_SACKO|nr:PREDICTED: G-protein coupled receptor 54-like [Saccoglossus kowalevskii]
MNITYSISNLTNNTSDVSSGPEDTGWINGLHPFWEKIFYISVVTVGVIGNTLVIVVFCSVKNLRCLTNIFIVSLAATDLFTCVVMIPLKLTGGWIISGVIGDMLCRLIFSEFPLWTACNASVGHLTAITLERYWAIIYPFKYESTFNRKTVALTILTIWMIAIILNSYFLYVFHVSPDEVCILEWPSVALQRVVGISCFIVTLIIPTTAMLFAYLRIIRSLRIDAREIQSIFGNGSPGMEKLTARRNVIRMLCIVVISFSICYIPNQTIFLIYNLGVAVDFNGVYYNITVCLVVSNSCMNPIIYAFRNSSFRKDNVHTKLGITIRKNNVDAISKYHKDIFNDIRTIKEKLGICNTAETAPVSTGSDKMDSKQDGFIIKLIAPVIEAHNGNTVIAVNYGDHNDYVSMSDNNTTIDDYVTQHSSRQRRRNSSYAEAVINGSTNWLAAPKQTKSHSAHPQRVLSHYFGICHYFGTVSIMSSLGGGSKAY